MHKHYRELYEQVAFLAKAQPDLLPLWKNVGELDDLDPMRVPSIKAIRRAEVPILLLTYQQEDTAVTLVARNPGRKRCPDRQVQIIRLECPRWLLSNEDPLPGGLTQNQMSRISHMVRESLFLFGIRMSNYFPVKYQNALEVDNSCNSRLRVRQEVPE